MIRANHPNPADYIHAARSEAAAFGLIGGDPSIDIEDATAEAILAVVEAAAAFDPSRGPFEAFARSVARNRIIDLSRRASRHNRIRRVQLIDPIDHHPTQSNDAQAIVAVLMQRLPDDEAAIVNLRVNGSTWNMIAAQTKIRAEKCAQLYHTAIDRLRDEAKLQGIEA